jgi:hypothetical protein
LIPVNWDLSRTALNCAAASLFVAAVLTYLPDVSWLQRSAMQSSALLAPLVVRLNSRAYWRALLACSAFCAGLAFVGFLTTAVIFVAALVAIYAATNISFKVASALQRLLNLFLSVPPGRRLREESRFAEAYSANSLIVAGALCASAAALLHQTYAILLGGLLAASGCYVAYFRDDRARRMEGELPFLMMLSTFYASAGHRGMDAALESLTPSSSRTMGALAFGRLSYLRERLFASSAPQRALDNFARLQRSGVLQEVVEGYSTVSSTGGDVRSYMQQQTERCLSNFEESWSSRVKTTRSLAEVLLLALALTPSVAITVSMVGLSSSYVLYALAVALPALTLLTFMFLDAYLPPMRDFLNVDWGLPLGLFMASASLFMMAGRFAVATTAAVAITSFLFPLAVQSQLESSCARRDERDSLRMLTSLVEALRVGKSVHEALKEVDSPALSPSFRRHLQDFSFFVDMGVQPAEAGALVESKSWITRACFIVVGHSMLIGGGLEILERFRAFLIKYVDSWALVRREALWTAALSSSLPFVTLGGVSVVNLLQSSFAGVGQTTIMALSLQSPPLASVLLTFVEVSALVALLSSKLAGLTIKSTPVALATMLATLASLVLYGLA